VPNQVLQDIHEFNDRAGFLGSGMDSFVEAAYALEETIEGYEDVFNNPDDPKAPVVTPRSWALGMLNQVKLAKENRKLPMPSEVEEFDKALDLCVFSIGKLYKMGLSPQQVEAGFKVVSTANLSKLSAGKDELGKQLKPSGWAGPEDSLQLILDARASNESS